MSGANTSPEENITIYFLFFSPSRTYFCKLNDPGFALYRLDLDLHPGGFELYSDTVILPTGSLLYRKELEVPSKKNKK